MDKRIITVRDHHLERALENAYYVRELKELLEDLDPSSEISIEVEFLKLKRLETDEEYERRVKAQERIEKAERETLKELILKYGIPEEMK